MRVAVLRALVMLCALMAAGIGFMGWTLVNRPTEDPMRRPVRTWAPDEIAAEAGQASGDTEDTTPETLARPLFSPTRRPFVPPPPEPPPPEIAALPEPEPPPPPPQEATPDPAGLKLKGVMLGASIAQALIATQDDPKGRWFEIGNMVTGFTLAAIEDDRVKLTAGSRNVELKLYVDNTPK